MKKQQSSREWGAGPWAVPVAVVRPPRPVMGGRAELEDVLNQRIRQRYGLLQQLRTPQGRWLARSGLITLMVLAWLAAIIFK